MKTTYVALLLGVGLTLTHSCLIAEDGSNGKGADIVALPCALAATEKSTKDGLSMKAFVDKSTYNIGQVLILEVTPSADAYITVLDQGSDPDSSERGYSLVSDAPVKANEIFKSGEWTIEGPAGANTFEIIASRLPYNQAATAVPEESAENKGGKSKNVALPAKGKVDTKLDEEISRCTLTFEIVEHPKP